MAAYRQLEETGGEALQAFNEYVEQERATTGRMALCLSPSGQAEVLAAFDRPEHRLQLFADWTSSGSGFSVKGITVPTPAATHAGLRAVASVG